MNESEHRGMEGTLITREVLFRESEFVPVLSLPTLDDNDEGDNESAGEGAHDGVDEGDDGIMDVEFVVRGDLDGDGSQELIFASIDGAIVIVKNRGGNQYHFQYPGTLPLDDIVCGIDIGPIYHHHTHTKAANVKTTANGIYVLTLDGTLLILSVEELKFLPSSPHYDYKCYDTSDVDCGTTKQIQKSIFTGVADLKVLLAIRPGGIVSTPAQLPLDIPANCTDLRVLDDRTCEEASHSQSHTCSVMIVMGGRDQVHLFAHDLLSLSVYRVCDGLPLDSVVHSLDLCSHKSYSLPLGNPIITNFLIAGTKSGEVLCWSIPSLARNIPESQPPTGEDRSGSNYFSEASPGTGAVMNPCVIPVVLGSEPPSPEPQQQTGLAYVRVLPSSTTLGKIGCRLLNQDLHFVVTWLDGRVAICKIAKRPQRQLNASGTCWSWSAIQCIYTPQVLYKADYFDRALFKAASAPAPDGNFVEQDVVSCAVTSWTGCTYLFTIKLPIHVEVPDQSFDDPGNLDHTVEYKAEASKGLSGTAQILQANEGDCADDSDADTLPEEGSSRSVEVPGLDFSLAPGHSNHGMESPELSGHGGSDGGIFKEQPSGDNLFVGMLESSMSSGVPDDDSSSPHGGNHCKVTDLSVSVSDDSWVGQDNVMYSFDSRVLTGASACRNFCCARQGDSQALIYISVGGTCTAIPNVSGQIRAFWPKVRPDRSEE